MHSLPELRGTMVAVAIAALLSPLPFALLFAVRPSLARADDLEIAKAHFATGLTYYSSERYAQAVKEFLEAYRLTHRADLLYNIARSYEKVDDAGRATAYYKRYLVECPEAAERVQVEADLYRLSQRVGMLVVITSPGTQILVDQEAIGRAPIPPLPLTEGRHHVEAQRGGSIPAVADVEMKGGQSVEVKLEPTAPAVALPIAPPALRVAVALPAVTTPVVVAAPTVPAPPTVSEVVVATANPPGAPQEAPIPPREQPTVVTPATRVLAPIAPEPRAGAAEKRPSRAWVWGVVVPLVLLAAGAAITLGLVFGGTDYGATARSMCGSGCALYDGAGGFQ
ncbi:MAG: hypothetical protein EXR72_23325 [Myxococcales bacterium]|nr:hypothetical protein [Myxococcales bacterium]